MTRNILTLIFAAYLGISLPVSAEDPVPVPVPGQPVEVPTTTLEEFPKELKHEGTRVYDIQLMPDPASEKPVTGTLYVTFKYETDLPGKIYVGAMPLSKKQYMGGYQPATLSEKQGEARVHIFCGAPTPAEPITTLEELRASYVILDQLEIQIYGQVKQQMKYHMPVKLFVVPNAVFTVQEKFYLDRLLQEVISLRKRVQELETRAPASSGK